MNYMMQVRATQGTAAEAGSDARSPRPQLATVAPAIEALKASPKGTKADPPKAAP